MEVSSLSIITALATIAAKTSFPLSLSLPSSVHVYSFLIGKTWRYHNGHHCCESSLRAALSIITHRLAVDSVRTSSIPAFGCVRKSSRFDVTLDP
ncbi:hypothetical protein Y032_0031g2376 [Ancylostoma ceylanicum]|uniref:Uncharacterized protein n=1 Tax=Ancylostoma ceylanicum TaxID=53326 RepID=A0A016US02_9BILA|nr:hypothetical protein Y032_0031g2376 [Ancylostoma ceylanicum]